MENLIKFDNFNSHNQGWFEIANRQIIYGSFEYKYGTSSVQSVYDTENYFKTKVNPKELTKAEFEAKRKEIHTKLAMS